MTAATVAQTMAAITHAYCLPTSDSHNTSTGFQVPLQVEREDQEDFVTGLYKRHDPFGFNYLKVPIPLPDSYTRVVGTGNSLIFDGIDDQVDCTNDATLWSQALNTFSFSCWIYPTLQDATARDVLRHGTAGSRIFCVLSSTTGNIDFTVRLADNTAGRTATSSSLVMNKWSHVVGVYDNTLGSQNVKIYLDGVLGGTTANLTESPNVSATLTLGGSSTDLQGNIKDFRWWTTKALNATEVYNIYNSSSSAPTPDYWLKMREGSGNPVDSIASKTTTLQNGATWSLLCPEPLVYEEVTVSDTLSRVIGKNIALSETTTVGEALTRLLAANRLLSTETVVISEDLQRIKGIIRALATETVSIGDSLNRLLAAARAFTENTSIGESLSRLLGANRSLPTETVVVSDSLARVKGLVRTIATETVTIGESLTRLQVLTRTLPETTVVGESLTRLLAANRSLATETVTVGESLTRMLAATRALSTETTVVGDSLNRTRGINRVLGTETVTVGESLTRQLTAIRALAVENTSIGEQLNRMLAAIRALGTETTVIGESLSYVYSPGGEGPNKVRALSDTVVIDESIARMIAANRALTTEVTAISESLQRQLAANRALSDSTTVGESLTKLRTVVRAIAIETVSIGESLARRFTGTRPLVESTVITDSLTKLLTQAVIPTQLKSIVQWLRAKYSISTPPKDPSY